LKKSLEIESPGDERSRVGAVQRRIEGKHLLFEAINRVTLISGLGMY
jgi:hypothetical protein